MSIVGGVGFRRLLYRLEPGYCVPSHTHMASLLAKKHVEGQGRLRKLLEEAEAVALTTDMWTSKAMEGYITMTVHFISSNWTMSSLVMATAGFVNSHTGANIGKRMVEIANEFGVAARVFAVTHDEAANQCACIRAARDESQQHGFDGQWKSVVCVARRFHTCLRWALDVDDIASVVAAGRKLVGHFRHSAKATHALKVAQEKAEMSPRKVIQDVPTRWNSTCCDVCLTYAKLSTRCFAIVMSASKRMRCSTYQPCNGALLRIW